MSGLIINKHPSHSSIVRDALKKLCFVKWAQSFEGKAASFNFGTSWIGPKEYIPFVCQPEHNVTIIVLGRIYDSDDAKIISSKFCKLAEKYRVNGLNALVNFSGAGALILFDHLKDSCFIVTDRMGFFPLYVTIPQPENNTIVCSHPDILAACYPKPLEYDETSLAEFLHSGVCTHPNTYYKDIKQLDPGTIYSWNNSRFKKTDEYWKPDIKYDPNASDDALAEELAQAIKYATNTRLNNVDGKTGILLSGGLDSRAVLFSADDPAERYVTITFCDDINREATIARELAQLVDVAHIILKRDFEYYGNLAVEAVRVSGGLWDFQDAHSLGFIEDINKNGIHLLFTGCFTDFLFKGLTLNTTFHRTFPLLLKQQKLANFNYAWYLPTFPIKNHELSSKIEGRIVNWYKGLIRKKLTMEDWMRIEQRRLHPISRTPDFSQRVVMYRTLPFDVINSDNHILQMFEKIPPHIKLNNKLFLNTLLKISPQSTNIVNSNTGSSVFASSVERIKNSFLNRSKRLISRFRNIPLERGIITDGSWINWQYYIKYSQVMKNHYTEIQQDSAKYINYILGYDVFGQPLDMLAKNDRLYTRLITLGLWLKYKIK
jgi:asparagine synthase (glutamine-hydrolysing)